MSSRNAADAPTIVSIGSRDVEDIARVHMTCFDEAWNARILTRILTMPGAFALGVRCGGKSLVGFAIGRVAEDKCELLSLGVAPASRGQGLGAMMLDAALARAGAVNARKFFLEVAEDNIAALTLYKARGMTQVGRRPNYYESKDGGFADALTMRVDLPLIISS